MTAVPGDSRLPAEPIGDQFPLRWLFSAVFWLAILFAAASQTPWQLTPVIVFIWLAALIVYQRLPGRMRRERATIAFLAALGSAVPVLMLGLTTVDPAEPEPVVQPTFESTAWRHAATSEGRLTVRSEMVEDLLQRYKPRGWSKDQVIELLGPPDWRPPTMRSFEMVYRLGIRPDGWALNDKYLYFRFDHKNRVTEFGTTVD